MADWSDGQVLVSGRSATSGGYGYWSGKPSEVFDIAGRESRGYDGANALTLPLPGGGRTGGGRPLMPGDKTFSEVRPVVSDGKSWWRCDVQGWREYDPQTGSPGRRSRPGFFEAALAGGDAKLLDGLCHLAPVPTGLGGSPLGTADGLLGWRAVEMPDGSQVGESVAGAVVRLSAEQVRRLNGASPAGASQFPGGGPRVAVLATRLSLLLWDGHCVGSEFKVGLLGERYASGSTVVPPLSWWHVLRPRDVNGSAALRAVTDDQGRALVAGAGKGTAAAIRRVLPGVTDPSLLAGVAGVLEIAVACAKLAQALPAPAPAPSSAPARPHARGGAPLTPKPTHPVLPDSLLTAALSGLSSQMNSYSSYHVRGDAGMAISSLQAAVALVGSPTKKGLRARLGLAREREQPGDLPLTGVEWTVVVGGLGAVALRAATEATTDEERHALVTFLGAVAETPLAEVDGRWREVTLIGKALPDDLPVVGTLLSTRHGSAVVLQVTQRWVRTGAVPLVTALEHSPSGSFGAVAGYNVEDSRVNSGWGGVGRVRELLNLLHTRGPAPWRPEAVASLVASTGITRAEASLLLAGLPRAGSYEHNFLPKHTRETLGLKVAEATAAQPAMTALTSSSRILLAGLAMPANPADLWDRGPDGTAVADMWLRSFGRRADVPDELLGELNAAMRHYHYPAATLLQGLADPDSCKWLVTDKRWSVVDGQLQSTGGQGGFDGAALVAAMSALLWLAYRLPKQDPLRANLPRTAERLRQRLNNPDLLVATLQDFDVSGLRQVYGHPPAPVTPGQQETLMLGKAGVMVDRGWGQQLYVRPAFLAGSDDPLLKAAGALFDPPTAALRLLADPGLDRLLQSLKDTSAGWAQDPLVSAPAVVPLAQEALGVDAAAARLYLQMLVLPDPTDKNIRGWNGWSPAELKKAGAALLGTGALVEGKRPRAGRAAFLPGGWLDVLAPMPPIEEWKVDLLGLVPDGRGPLGVTVPAAPLGELFVDAWERVSAGEGPMLQQLETRRRR